MKTELTVAIIILVITENTGSVAAFPVGSRSGGRWIPVQWQSIVLLGSSVLLATWATWSNGEPFFFSIPDPNSSHWLFYPRIFTHMCLSN